MTFEEKESQYFESVAAETMTAMGQVTLSNVRKACRLLQNNDAKISVTRVANFIADIDNYETFEKYKGKIPPKRQSIQNNKRLRSLVALYESEQAKEGTTSTRQDEAVQSYPSEGLDNKTKVYINLLRQQVDALRAENTNLGHLLEEKSSKAPIDLSLSYATTREAGLPNLALVQDIDSNTMEAQLMERLANLPVDYADYFAVKTREGRSALFLLSPSGDRRLLNSSEWSFVTQKARDEN